jgi:hypothetical protein
MSVIQTGIVKVMDGWLLWHICNEPLSQTTTLTQKQDALEGLTFLLGYLTTKGFQHTWQIKLDYMGNLKAVSVM